MVKSNSRRSQSDERAEAGARAADTIIRDMEQRTPIASEGVRSLAGGNRYIPLEPHGDFLDGARARIISFPRHLGGYDR